MLELLKIMFTIHEPFYIYSCVGFKNNRKIDLIFKKEKCYKTLPSYLKQPHLALSFHFFVTNMSEILENCLLQKDIISLFLYRYPHEFEDGPSNHVTLDIPTLLFYVQVLEVLHQCFYNKYFIDKNIWKNIQKEIREEI